MLFSLLYDFVLLIIGIAALPHLFWKWLKYGKYRESLKMRLGFELPQAAFPKKKLNIWIHAISMGETRAVIPLFHRLRASFPEADIFISSTTETGHAEAKRSLSNAAGYFFLPLDFSWIVKKVVKKIKPDILILVESDFWYHLLKYAEKEGTKIFLVNGKISERSAKRFATFRSFSTRIFKHFTRLCVQNPLYYERFLNLGIPGEKLIVTGNLKFDVSPQTLTPLEKTELKKSLSISEQDRVIVIGSTHEPEEEWLLSAIDVVWKKNPHLKVLLVPRHPERFDRVMSLLKARGLNVLRYTQRDSRRGDEQLILIDTMGMLFQCYQLADIAIVGGSFVKGIGGHNIFEPIERGIPTLFGPHMENQLELVDTILRAKAGKQVTLEELPPLLLFLLEHAEERETLIQNAKHFAEEMKGSAERTFETIFLKELSCKLNSSLSKLPHSF